MRTIRRRDFLRATGAGVALSSFPGAVRGESATPSRPNVVLIISDDQGFAEYGFMGHPVVQTPRLDRLARQSVVFTRGYVTTALCSPSLATMLTGLYPHQHRITGNDPANKDQRPLWYEAFEKCPRLPAMLGEKGYLSLQTGKYWMGHYSRAGFTHGMTTKGRHGDAGLAIGRKTMQPIYDFIDEARAKQRPFFVWYAPFMPHLPHTPPKRFLDKYLGATKGRDQALYFAMCEWFDETCGQLLDFLDRRKLSEDTLVVYVCDNGWPIRADWDEVPGNGGKGSPYELGVRTPIMLRWPGHVSPQIDRNTLACNLDIVPTILSACGLEPTDAMPGLNLLDRKALERRDTLFLENFAHDMADIDAPEKSLRARSCIHGDWKLILWKTPQPKLRTSGPPKPEADVELYNLKEDPFEDRNLAALLPEEVSDLTKRIERWW